MTGTGTTWEMKRCSETSGVERCFTSSDADFSDADRKRKRSDTDWKGKRKERSSNAARKRKISGTDRKEKISDTDRRGKGKSSDADRKRKRKSSDTDQKTKRKKRGSSSKASCGDRLTTLPDQILGQILSLLPTEDVAAMQVLSKRLSRGFSLIASYVADREKKRKKCDTSSKPLCGDRLTTLPDKILGRILSLLPTEEVAAMQVLSKRLSRAFSLITSFHAGRKRKRSDKRKMKSSDEHRKKGKTCGTSSKPLCGDRLTTLPDHVLGKILSLLPTKDVSGMQVLSKKLGQAFSLITSVDLDDSPICHCICYTGCRLRVEHFPLFKSFVAKVLQKLLLSGIEDPLTRFRLSLARNFWCQPCCYPYLEPALLNGWISYPLAHKGLRELDLTFRISNHEEYNLPPQLFDCPSLEVFRLASNVRIDSALIPLICLPNVKVVHIFSVFFTEVKFISRLLSSCPSLEDLSIDDCLWEEFECATISSHSLRRLVLWLVQYDKFARSQLLTIDTPSLQYLSLSDDLPSRYSVTLMNSLVEAKLDNNDRHLMDIETSWKTQLSLLSALTAVHHLSLAQNCLETMNLAAELKDPLPMFHNLRSITLATGNYGEWRWDRILLLILRSSPLLETLVFPLGIFEYRSSPLPNDKEDAYLEAEGWRTNTLPSRCLTHLKRIEFGYCFGIDRELNMIKFFLGKASALEEIVLCLFKDFNCERGCRFPEPNFEEFVGKLEELPRVSNSCSIKVHR